MMMNRKDVEAYQKSYEEIDIFLNQFPHLKDVVLEGLRGKSGKNLFRKLNEHSKKLQVKQEEIIKKHNSLSAEYEELEHLKNSMNGYLGRDKTEKKESVIDNIEKYKIEEHAKSINKKRNLREVEREFM